MACVEGPNTVYIKTPKMGTDADIHPDEDAKVLQVRLNPRSNIAVQRLLDHLNAAEFTYPGTNFRLTYTLWSPAK